MFRKRNGYTLLLVLAMTISLLAGCADSKNEPNNSGGNVENGSNAGSNNAGNGGNNAEADGLSGHLVTKDPLELTIHMHFADRVSYQDDWPVFQKAAELTNISLKGTAPSSATNSQELFNITMASGELPDIVHFNMKDVYDNYGVEGAFEPLNDLIDEHAPNIKALFEERPELKRYATASDGNIYYINFIPDGQVAKGWFIREDWLEKLQLEAPKTVDELYTVMKAFREQDPNGNGQKDEVPYFARVKSAALDFLVFWNANRGLYLADSKIGFGPYEDAYKTGVQNIAEWYKEGLIDPEIFTRGSKGRDIMLREDRGGITHDWLGSTAGYNDLLQGERPDFAFMPLLPPASIDGQMREETKRAEVTSSGWGIASTSKHKVEAIKYFDFWFSEEGRRLMNFGIEGVHYDMIDGKPIFKEEYLNAENGTLAALQEDGVQIEIGFHQNFDYERQWSNAIALQGEDMYTKANVFMEQYPTLSYANEERDRLTTLKSAIETYVEEMSQKWILGAEDLTDDSFAAFQKSLKNMGVEEMLQLEQQAYDRFMSQ
ncbi:extracellular solute-binding protein [Paenibacillus sp. J5C_2022]|uniref:extracellular solute-binding protein n=1 Tax=Paenibacillus sp. J5C2022 TaxID=2977129 RepID=UPI0021CEF0AE|nr:extracellular solute-binding protein [Paenibacillus sp. J5C2022]MCU6708550.1 extracellular solute-binding protein [Paenibacillus sp. J5C2022]